MLQIPVVRQQVSGMWLWSTEEAGNQQGDDCRPSQTSTKPVFSLDFEIVHKELILFYSCLIRQTGFSHWVGEASVVELPYASTHPATLPCLNLYNLGKCVSTEPLPVLNLSIEHSSILCYYLVLPAPV